MSDVIRLADHRPTMAVSNVTPIAGPPSTLRFNATAKALAIAYGLMQRHGLEDCNVSVFSEGTCVVLDYTGLNHPAGAVRVACGALGWVCQEVAAETADGSAAIELRGAEYLDGVLRVVKAVVPLDPRGPR